MLTDLIFDFFGTLVGYTHGAFVGEPYDATHRLLLDHGYDITYRDFVSGWEAVAAELEAEARRTHVEYHMRDVGNAFFDRRLGPRPPAALVDRFVDQFVWEWNRGTVLERETADLIDRWAGRYRLSVISNTHYPPLIHHNLDVMGVAGRFQQVITSVEYGRRKPDPAIFAYALGRLGVGPEAVLYIGDNPHDDIVGAARAGVPAVLLDPAHRWSDITVPRVPSLRALDALLDQR